MKIKKFKLEIGKHPAGIPFDINGYTISSGKKGKKVYIQGGMHGGEVTYWIVKKVFEFVKENIISGEVVFVPFSNPVSWLQRTYFSTYGKFDLYMGKDWNRNFPGNIEESLGDRIAFRQLSLAQKADLAIDLHTSRASFPFGIVFSEKDFEYLKLAGLKYNYFKDLSGLNSAHEYFHTLSGQLFQKDIRNVTLECGSHDAYEPKYIEMVSDGIINMLNSLKITKGKVKNNRNVYYYTRLDTYFAKEGGIITFNKKIGDEFKKGEKLYEIETDLNKEPISVYAREDGILEKVSPTHIYWPGDEVLEAISKDNLSLVS